MSDMLPPPEIYGLENLQSIFSSKDEIVDNIPAGHSKVKPAIGDELP